MRCELQELVKEIGKLGKSFLIICMNFNERLLWEQKYSDNTT